MYRTVLTALFAMATCLLCQSSTVEAGHGFHFGGGGGGGKLFGGGGGGKLFGGGGGKPFGGGGSLFKPGKTGGWNKPSGHWHQHGHWGGGGGDWGSGYDDGGYSTPDTSSGYYDPGYYQQQQVYYPQQTYYQPYQPADVQVPINALPVGVDSYAPAGGTVQSVMIENPARNAGTVNYVFGSESTALPSGQYITHGQAGQEIVFDRGGSYGQVRYTLNPGSYRFIATSTGWDLRSVRN